MNARTAICLLGVALLAVCHAQEDNTDFLAGLKVGRATWKKVQSEYGLEKDYQFRLYRPCVDQCADDFPFCLLGDNGPFYITVKDGEVSEVLLMWSDTPLDSSKFKTIEEIFDELEAQAEAGVKVDDFWRFDDLQGVPDDVVIRPAGVPYAARIVVRLPPEAHLNRVNAAQMLFASKGIKDYSFTFQRLCFGCGPAKTMVVKDGVATDGGMTMQDVYELMREVILSEPLFLDIFIGDDGIPSGMDVDQFNAIIDGDTKDTVRISDFKEL
ncbi:hypothetical protein BSKO_07683 [Bryopsis sp. KO-2023]|nr:hypothetical protein BSKO_07683 [Bryopsis sp. KO-2023]